MLNTPLVADMIFKGEVGEIKELMKRSRELGMQTFDQALFDLYEANAITYEDALRNADSVNDLRLQIKLHSQRARNPDLARRHRAPDDRLSGSAAANGRSQRAAFGFHESEPTPRAQNLRPHSRRAAWPFSAWA